MHVPVCWLCFRLLCMFQVILYVTGCSICSRLLDTFKFTLYYVPGCSVCFNVVVFVLHCSVCFRLLCMFQIILHVTGCSICSRLLCTFKFTLYYVPGCFVRLKIINNRIQRRNSNLFTISSLRLQHVRSSGPGANVCTSRETHRALITCNMTCYVPRSTKGQLSY